MLAEETGDWTLDWTRRGMEEGRKVGLKEGRKEGETSILRRQLTLRFGPLPDWVDRRLSEASVETLELWGERILDAVSLEEVFDAPSSD